MTEHHSIASVGSLLGEPTRAAMLLALLDGRALPAGELARVAGLSAAATSLHLSKLADGGLLTVRREGRHRYYQLASREVARLLEAVGVLATKNGARVALSPARAKLRLARSCYDHLAGVYGVALTALLEARGALEVCDEYAYSITACGARWFSEVLEIEVEQLKSRRTFARRCLDWTERRPHLAGAVGAAVLDRLLAKRWLTRTEASRALRVTTRGELELAKLGVRCESA